MTPAPPRAAPDDGVRWLALLLLEGLELIAKGIRARYGLRQGCSCPRCGHRS